MRNLFGGGELLAFLRLIDVELLDDLLVFDRDVVALLIPIDQLLHGRGQVAIGRDDGDELADVEPSLERQIPTDGVEEEGGELGQEIVEKFHREFAIVEVEPDEEEASEPRADLGTLIKVRGVGADAGPALNDLTDASRELARGDLASLPEADLLAPQDRDDDALDRDD